MKYKLFVTSFMLLIIITNARAANRTPIDVRNPMVRDRRAIADVVVINEKQKAFTITVDLLTGSTCANPHN